MFKEKGKALEEIMGMMDGERAKKIKIIVEGDSPKEVALGLDAAKAKLESKEGVEESPSEEMAPVKKSSKIFDPMKNIADREPEEEEVEEEGSSIGDMVESAESKEPCCSLDSIMSKLSPEEQKMLKLKMKV